MRKQNWPLDCLNDEPKDYDDDTATEQENSEGGDGDANEK